MAGMVFSACSTIKIPTLREFVPTVGYSLTDNTVLFEFHIEQYKWVTNGTTDRNCHFGIFAVLRRKTDKRKSTNKPWKHYFILSRDCP